MTTTTATTADIITRLILLVALAVFAIYGITTLAPAIGDALSNQLEHAVRVK